MTSSIEEPRSRAPIAGWRWGIVWLMFLATLLNYMDRQTLGSAVRFIKDELGLTEEGYGWIEFWFLLSYALFQVPAGFLADRMNLRWLYAGALLAWSAAGFLTGLAETVLLLSVCRLVLGMAEAFNWPCAVGVVRRLVPLESRGLANGVFHSGASAGAVLTPLLVLMLVGEDGRNWRLLFQFVGALGLVWVVLWFVFVRGPRAEALATPAVDAADDQQDKPAQTFAQVLLSRAFWVTMAVGIAVNICWHFYRVWLPRFLDVDLHLSQRQVQLVLAGFFVAADLGSLGSGYLTRRLVDAGSSVEWSRKIVLLAAATLCLLSIPAALFSTAAVTIPLLLPIAAGAMGGFPIYFALSQEAAPRQPALCLGVTGAVALLSIGALSPLIGKIVDQIGTFGPSLIAIGCVPMVGAVLGLLWPEQRPVS
jgi:ACS family hexuronate transporter-like MFS transporter